MEKLFRKLDLNENEQEVYLAVLKAGKIAPNQVAKITGINRTTVYSVAKKLGTLGLMTQDLGQKVSYLVATPPEKLVTLFEREEKKVAEKKQVAKTLAQELKSLVSEKHYSVPRIRFIEESDIEEYLYEAYPRWSASVEAFDNTWRGFQDDSFTRRYEKWIDWTWKYSRENIHAEIFFNQAEIEQKLFEKHRSRKMRILPETVRFDSNFWVAGEYLIMVQTRTRPHYLVEIHDAVLARNQRELFKALWQLAPAQSLSS
jgi:sugar-specific transcriptional regulator TrmB